MKYRSTYKPKRNSYLTAVTGYYGRARK
ncbi:hypothetical protein XbC2_20 [Xanthomonas phage XbC2]|nr:hypothetical protein XbC2_20 [Xanthomonas phage XbC2]